MSQWKSKSEQPKRSGWYVTASLDLPSYSVPRYFDNTEPEGINWSIARSNGGGDGLREDDDYEPPLVVNMSFDMWCEMPVLSAK